MIYYFLMFLACLAIGIVLVFVIGFAGVLALDLAIWVRERWQ